MSSAIFAQSARSAPYSSQAPLRVRWGVNVLRADFLPWKLLPRDDPALRTNALTPALFSRTTLTTAHAPPSLLMDRT
ncbi:hypothetical protein CDAR_526061 [Caerostris darwini]|uniref:Uncharacterized protein n=1 Tax=Caerostris darwini TaxID=1538125 RepID=A0AAV4PZY7_9ARAC|nr:hypothetical protein CDAR_526061 [Caerostris darwini]